MDYMLIFEDLLSSIKNSKLNYEVQKTLTKIYSDKKLLENINKYKITKDEKIRKEIYSNENYMKYKHLENEVNMLILKLNKIFKELKEDDYENN